jgi:hypothetical protein
MCDQYRNGDSCLDHEGAPCQPCGIRIRLNAAAAAWRERVGK